MLLCLLLFFWVALLGGVLGFGCVRLPCFGFVLAVLLLIKLAFQKKKKKTIER